MRLQVLDGLRVHAHQTLAILLVLKTSLEIGDILGCPEDDGA